MGRSTLAWIVFIAVQTIWLPLSIAGGALVAYRQIRVSARLGVSQTAIEIINGRWAIHTFGVADQWAAAGLAKTLPNTSTFGLMVTLLPLRLARAIAGHPILYPLADPPERLAVTNFVPWRTTSIEKFLSAQDDVTQWVILGAGLDTRAYDRLSGHGERVWEVDTAPNVAFKRQQVARAGLKHDHVRYVETDFANSEWPMALRESGFDPQAKTLFLLEGVTLYLTRGDVTKTLRLVSSVASAGSIVVMDIYSQELVQAAQRPSSQRVLALTGELIRFGLDFRTDPAEAVRELLNESGLGLKEIDFLAPARTGGPHLAVVAAYVPD